MFVFFSSQISGHHTTPHLPSTAKWSADGQDDPGGVVGVSLHHLAAVLRLGQKRPQSWCVPHKPRFWLHHLLHSGSLLHSYAGHAGHVLQDFQGSPQKRRQAPLHRLFPPRALGNRGQWGVANAGPQARWCGRRVCCIVPPPEPWTQEHLHLQAGAESSNDTGGNRGRLWLLLAAVLHPDHRPAVHLWCGV